MTQKDVGEKINRSAVTISGYEIGHIVPPPFVLRALAVAVETTTAALLSDHADPARDYADAIADALGAPLGGDPSELAIRVVNATGRLRGGIA